MSADNYTVCPRCAEVERNRITTATANLEKSYGKVDAAVFLTAKEALDKMKAQPMHQSLREDYELGINPDGTFDCSYSCSCSECGWGWEFKHQAEPNTSPRRKKAA